MHLVIETTKKSFSFPANNVLVVGNDFDCDVQINHPKVWGRHFSIDNKDYGCVLNVFDQNVTVNHLPVVESCLLDSGDLISIDDMSFRLIDDQYIPKDSKLNHTNVVLDKAKNESSVFGIRSFTEGSAGYFIIDDFHHPEGWHVFRGENELHFIDNKHKTKLNGLQIAQAKLVNGDVISGKNYKYKIELPGTSGFSKFSPSHPRNVQLSESFIKKGEQIPAEKHKPHDFLKTNLWWLTILVGLIVLLIVVLNNPPG